MRKLILITNILLLFILSAKAQFIVTESFKGGTSPGIITGGSATLTSGYADPINDGWLRLTSATGNQSGYAYVNTPFPSSLGVIMEFEYKSWRNTDDATYHGADGFCVFLFDAATTTFKIGGYGGSLGYAPNSEQGVTTGLSGGYIGIGFDEYGNFARSTEGRIEGTSSLKPNSVTLRGPTTASASTTNKYLKHNQLQPDPKLNGNSIDYNTVTSTRPKDADFYRKIKITIVPTGTGFYKIDVYWQTTKFGVYESIISYTTSTPPPPNLKLGFAGATGGGFNYHEIRNIYITTTGNVRVNKEVDKANINVGDQLTYTVDVTNENDAVLNGILLGDTLKSTSGTNLALESDFKITSITFNNQGNSGTTASGYTSGVAKTSGFTNPWSTSLNMAKGSKATFTVVGTVNSRPEGNYIKNSVGINTIPSGITDLDPTNNYATVSNMVLSPNVDFVVSKTLDSYCADPVKGNTFTITVSNIGATASDQKKQVTVTDVIPSGLTIDSIRGEGWTINSNNNSYTITRSTSLKSAYSYPPIKISVKAPSTKGLSWTNTANVTYAGTESNTTNNSSSTTLYTTPNLVITNPPAACSPGTVNLTASAVTAGSTSNLKYAYYTDAAATTVLSNPAAVATSGTYYIRATNVVGCTSAIMPVTVKINYSLSGTVFNDRNGMADNIVNGIGTNAGNTLRIVVYNNTTSKVENVVSVTSDGTYSSCTSTIGNSYTLYLTTAALTAVGQTAVPLLTLATLARYTGEHIGMGAGSDGAVDGKVPLGTISNNISDINFGIRFMRSCVISNKNVTKEL